MRSPRLPESVIDDRITRYMTDEPLWSIAKDHGVGPEAIIRTANRHAPNLVGLRRRGGGAREWPPAEDAQHA